MTERPPIATKIIAVHLNYHSRAEERGRVPEFPSYFFKPPSSQTSTGTSVARPPGTELLNYEGEVAIIMGATAHAVTPEEGFKKIGWLAPANDIGLYDFRWADAGSNVRSKGQDGFTPIGQAVSVKLQKQPDIGIRTLVNGEIVQEDTTKNLMFSFGELVADLSRYMTLLPGDIILTGTPAGSRPLSPGDIVEVELEGFGSVRNPIIESDSAALLIGAQPRVDDSTRAQAWSSNGKRSLLVADEVLQSLTRVSTATITVQLAKRGVTHSFIRGLQATRPSARLIGFAATLRYLPLREDVRDADKSELNAQKRAIESISAGEVLVIEAREDPGAGTIGDILAARALARGATGIVTDGGLRDSRAVTELEIPTYYKAANPYPLGVVHFPYDTNIPIACGGVLVMPGDVIVGDGDGVVVVPPALAAEVAADSLNQEAQERWALNQVQKGASIRGIYPLTEARRAEFEAWQDKEISKERDREVFDDGSG